MGTAAIFGLLILPSLIIVLSFLIYLFSKEKVLVNGWFDPKRMEVLISSEYGSLFVLNLFSRSDMYEPEKRFRDRALQYCYC